MVQLTDKQVDIISQRIVSGGVDNLGLQNNLLDHYCCFIETEMDKGVDFDTAYKIAFKAITPNGMHEIQDELFFLLTFKKQVSMKRIIYGSGFLAAFAISMGIMFRTMHFPGANVFMCVGFLALIVVSSALVVNAMRHLHAHSLSYNVRTVVGFLSAMLISVGTIFKILHFPSANVQIVLGMSLLNFIFMPMFFYHLYKQSLSKVGSVA